MPHLIAALLIPWLLFSVPEQVLGVQSADNNRHIIVLDLDANPSFTPSEEQLSRAQTMGIDFISFSDSDQLGNLSIQGYAVILQSEIIFPVRNELFNLRDIYAQNILNRLERTEDLFPGQIAAVEVFQYPDESDEYFLPFAANLSEVLSEQTDIPLFYTSAYPDSVTTPNGFRFKSIRVAASMDESDQIHTSIKFIPDDSDRVSLSSLNRIFLQTSGIDNSIIFLPADWFFTILENKPELDVVITEYLNGNYIPIPLPADTTSTPAINWSVLFLFLIWISFVIHFRFQPVYAQTISRYYLNHSFYLIDVFEHRIRNILPGIIVLIQHALLTGLFFFVSAEILISDLGLRALSNHLPYLFLFQNELLSLFFLGVSVALLLQIISVAWIYLLNSKMKYVSQALNLYSWPLHINLIVVTFLVVLNQRGSAELWMVNLSILFAIVWFLSFNIAAIDGARFLDKYKILNIFLTVGIHTLLVSFVIWFILYSPTLIEPLRMAISFP